MVSWKDDLKFPVGTWLHFGTLKFTTREDGKLELQAQERVEQLREKTRFRFPQGLKNLVTLFLKLVSTLDSPLLGTLLEIDLFAVLDSSSTLMAKGLKNSTTWFWDAIRAWGSHAITLLEIDLLTGLDSLTLPW
jgi:hypothetical protein